MQLPKSAGQLSYTQHHHLSYARSQSGERAVILPPAPTPPTVDDLLSMFTDITQVDADPLAGVLDEGDILEETIMVQEEWLEEVTQVNPPTVSLQVYYFQGPVWTDVDLIASFSWQVISYLPGGSEEYVTDLTIDGFECQCYRVADGFIASIKR